ncbi:Clavaminate synthase-like protein [Neolentinus lepideus HHB14362 ss-1]|uniref:Clavaminate synthase-like protein n=1 Tax=Neolentinus lepideus HHB14362 ss-1 TaxID=1314782 RepID=A0A165Q1V5_9AGAM|nr:Clavaminate synthase-like protein [Neolentinus lepideus HHB14362 ss-1]
MHMDLLYFEHPPRFQILHCLRNRVKGGTSLFLDALHASQQLRAADPKAFETLTSTPVPFHYVNDGHHLRYEHPTIELAPTYPPHSHSLIQKPEIAYINYSPPFQALLPVSTPASFYTSLRAFSHLLDDPANVFEYTLREGDAVVFDNRRVLHARSAFEDGEVSGGAGETRRWLKGCYLEADGVMDRGRVLRDEVGEA